LKLLLFAEADSLGFRRAIKSILSVLKYKVIITMAEFKLVIADPKTGKCTQVVVSENNTTALNGKKIGDKVKGESFDMPGYEFEITGGADYCGFPMRKDIEGPVRKKILLTDGVGIRNKEKGIRKRKTVCGNTIHDNITQVSMKILKQGKKPLGAEPSEEKVEEPKEQKPEEKPAETPKEEAKTEPKPVKEEQKTEEKKQETPKEGKAEKEKKELEKQEKPSEEPKKDEKKPEKA